VYEEGRYRAERRWNPFLRSPFGGRAISALELPWFTVRPPVGFGVLTTTGRKTGKPRRKCVRAIRVGDRVFLVAIGGTTAAWFRNTSANPEVVLRIRSGAFRGLARPPLDDDELREAEDAYVGTVNRFDFTECRFHRPGRPTRERIQELHRAWFHGGAPVVIDLEE
jgi:deazaflavin-dependent oxidoreductase (nitroreductase family)